jgi:hypothetical protein
VGTARSRAFAHPTLAEVILPTANGDEADDKSKRASQATQTRLHDLLLMSLLSFAAVMVCGDAFACRGVEFARTIFFDEIPQARTAQTIGRVAIIRLTGAIEYSWRSKSVSYSGIARVDKVLKGQVGSRLIAIVAPHTDCDVPFSVGSTGIVLGDLARDVDGNFQLKAKPQYVDPQSRERFGIDD